MPTSLRRAVYALALLVLAVAPAQEAKAQWAVIDPAHIAKSVWNGRKIVNQLTAQRDQLRAFRDNIQKLRSYNLRDVTGFMAAVDATLVSGAEVAYSSASLPSDFYRVYTGVDVSDTRSTTDTWLSNQLDGSLGTLRSLREHAVQLQAARRDLTGFQSQIRSATTAQQIAEVQGTVQAYGVQESQLLRQVTMLQVDQQARAEASQAAQRAYATAVARDVAARSRASARRIGGRDYGSRPIL
ncbi:type IV secretion system protein [Rubrivirga litoralis]|uniref:Type IV secretion system protein n=1 Tax=Rubrivirga litoralis TaxID=3075598 RepID=A0ABU3BRW3_9BACT|nr:type IV secretion system protein [Rubrivirga sp. F394]MDT0631985.1 type IV secretion system protein [Rubrivirga sp. F394]